MNGFNQAAYALSAAGWGNLPQVATKGTCMDSTRPCMHSSQSAGEVWPLDLKTAPSFETFWRGLNTFLFRKEKCSSEHSAF